eukprot:7378299-Prymnesium_polylepis.1
MCPWARSTTGECAAVQPRSGAPVRGHLSPLHPHRPKSKWYIAVARLRRLSAVSLRWRARRLFACARPRA